MFRATHLFFFLSLFLFFTIVHSTVCPFIIPGGNLPPGTEAVCPYTFIPPPPSPTLADRIDECVAPFSTSLVPEPTGKESHCPYVPLEPSETSETSTLSNLIDSGCKNNSDITIIVPGGTYPAAFLQMNCSHSITLISSNIGDVIFDGAYGWTTLFPNMSITLINITLDGTGTSNPLFKKVRKYGNITLDTCIIRNYAGIDSPVIEMDICDDSVGITLTSNVFQNIPGTSVSAIGLAFMFVTDNTWDKCGGATQDATYFKGDFVSKNLYIFTGNALWAVVDNQPPQCKYKFVDDPFFQCIDQQLYCYDEFATQSKGLCPLVRSVPGDLTSELVYAEYCRVYAPCKCAPVDFIVNGNETVTLYIGDWLFKDPDDPTKLIPIPCNPGITELDITDYELVTPLFPFVAWNAPVFPPPMSNHTVVPIILIDGIAGECKCPNPRNITKNSFCSYDVIPPTNTTGSVSCVEGNATCFGNPIPGMPCIDILSPPDYDPLIAFLNLTNCTYNQFLYPNILYPAHINVTDIPVYNNTVPPGYLLEIDLVCMNVTIARSIEPCTIPYQCRCDYVPGSVGNTTTTTIVTVNTTDPFSNVTTSVDTVVEVSTPNDFSSVSFNCIEMACTSSGTLECNCDSRTSLGAILGFTPIVNCTAFHIDNIPFGVFRISNNRAQQLDIALHVERIYYENIVPYSITEPHFFDEMSGCREIINQNNLLLEGTVHDCVWGAFDYWNIQYCDDACRQSRPSPDVLLNQACLVDRDILDSDVLLGTLKYHVIQEAIEGCPRPTVVVRRSDNAYDEILHIKRKDFLLISYDGAQVVGSTHKMDAANITIRGMTFIHAASRQESLFRFVKLRIPYFQLLNCQFLGSKLADAGILNIRSQIDTKSSALDLVLFNAAHGNDIRGAQTGGYFSYKYNYAEGFRADILQILGNHPDISWNKFEDVQGGCIHITHVEGRLNVDENIFINCHGPKKVHGATIVKLTTDSSTVFCLENPEKCSIRHNRQHKLTEEVDYDDTCYLYENIRMDKSRIAHNMCESARFGMRFKGGTSVRTFSDFEALQRTNALIRPSRNRISKGTGFDFVIMEFDKESSLITFQTGNPTDPKQAHQNYVANQASETFIYSECNYPCAGHKVLYCEVNKNFDLSFTPEYGVTQFNNFTESMKYCNPPDIVIPDVIVTSWNASRHRREYINITRSMSWYGSPRSEKLREFPCCELFNVTCFRELVDEIAATNRSVYIQPLTLTETFVNISAYFNGTQNILEIFNITDIVLNCSLSPLHQPLSNVNNTNPLLLTILDCTSFQYFTPLGECYFGLGIDYLNQYPGVNLTNPFVSCNASQLNQINASLPCFEEDMFTLNAAIFSYVSFDLRYPGTAILPYIVGKTTAFIIANFNAGNPLLYITPTCTSMPYYPPTDPCYFGIGITYLNQYPTIEILNPFVTCNLSDISSTNTSSPCYEPAMIALSASIFYYLQYDEHNPGTIESILGGVNTTTIIQDFNATTMLPINDTQPVCLMKHPPTLDDLLRCKDNANDTDVGGCQCLYNPPTSCFRPVVHGRHNITASHNITSIEFHYEIQEVDDAVDHFFTGTPVQYINYTDLVMDGRDLYAAGFCRVGTFLMGVDPEDRYGPADSPEGKIRNFKSVPTHFLMRNCAIKNYARYDAQGLHDVINLVPFVNPPEEEIDPLNPNDPRRVPNLEEPAELNSGFAKIAYDKNGNPKPTSFGAAMQSSKRPNFGWLNSTVKFVGDPKESPGPFNRYPENGVNIQLSDDYFTFVPTNKLSGAGEVLWEPGLTQLYYNASVFPAMEGIYVEFVNKQSPLSHVEITNCTFDNMAGRSLDIEDAVNWIVYNVTLTDVGGKKAGEYAIVYVNGNTFYSGIQIFANVTHSQSHRVIFDRTSSGSAPGYLATFYIRTQQELVDVFMVENCTCDGSMPICFRFEQIPYRNLMKTLPPYPQRVVLFYDILTPLREIYLNNNQDADGNWHDLVWGPPYKDFFHEKQSSSLNNRGEVFCDDGCGIKDPRECYVQLHNVSIVPQHPWYRKYLFTDVNDALQNCLGVDRVVNVMEPKPYDLYFFRFTSVIQNITLRCNGDTRIVGSGHFIDGYGVTIENCLFIHSGPLPTWIDSPNPCKGPIVFSNNTFQGEKTLQPAMKLTVATGFSLLGNSFDGYKGNQSIILTGCVCYLNSQDISVPNNVSLLYPTSNFSVPNIHVIATKNKFYRFPGEVFRATEIYSIQFDSNQFIDSGGCVDNDNYLATVYIKMCRNSTGSFSFQANRHTQTLKCGWSHYKRACGYTIAYHLQGISTHHSSVTITNNYVVSEPGKSGVGIAFLMEDYTPILSFFQGCMANDPQCPLRELFIGFSSVGKNMHSTGLWHDAAMGSPCSLLTAPATAFCDGACPRDPVDMYVYVLYIFIFLVLIWWMIPCIIPTRHRVEFIDYPGLKRPIPALRRDWNPLMDSVQ